MVRAAYWQRSCHAVQLNLTRRRVGGEKGYGLNQGIFYPELTLGAEAISYGRKLELQQFLAEVVHQRGCALHLANLWNALYFGYDLKAKGFRAEVIDPKRIPVREARKRDFSLPVGGFLRVHTAAACGDLLGEVIYKEGAHPNLEEDFVEPSLSGAPATLFEEFAGQTVAVVNERFVLDLDAFGADGNCIDAKQYNRLLGRERWLDGRGHLLIEAVYPPSQAGLEDVSYYIEYLLANHRDGLLAFCFRAEPSEDDLREALLNSFAAVRELALGASDLMSWRGKYFFAAAAYRERVIDGEAILGGGDLSSLYRGLTRIPQSERRCYAAIGPRIIALLEQDGLDAEEEALVRGCAYATAVTHANVFVSERLAVEQRSGVLEGGTHLRLDDDWQAGGIWRAERVEDADRYSLRTVPPMLPLGLGYSEGGDQATVEEEIADAAPELGATVLGFTVYLTKRDRALGRLRMLPEGAARLASGQVDVLLKHDSESERMQVERDGNCLYGIDWPWSCHVGIALRCNLESGQSVVKVRTEVAVPPLQIEGHELRFQTNERVFLHEMNLEELSAADRRGFPSLSELIHKAFRTRGRDRGDGSRALNLAELATIVLGPAWQPGESRAVAQALAEMGLTRDGADYIWRPRVTQQTRVADLSLLEAYGEASPDRRLARIVHRHWVPMHLRELAPGWKASAEKRLDYAEARRRYGMHGILREELPKGFTWVEPHERGGEGEELTVSQLDLAVDARLDEVAEPAGHEADATQPIS